MGNRFLPVRFHPSSKQCSIFARCGCTSCDADLPWSLSESMAGRTPGAILAMAGRSLESMPPPSRPGPAAACLGRALERMQAPMPPLAEAEATLQGEADMPESEDGGEGDADCWVSSLCASSRGSSDFAGVDGDCSSCDESMEHNSELSTEDWTSRQACTTCCLVGNQKDHVDDEKELGIGSQFDTASTVDDSGAGIWNWLCSGNGEEHGNGTDLDLVEGEEPNACEGTRKDMITSDTRNHEADEAEDEVGSGF